MADAQDPNDAELPPPGSRWGIGAQSVLPYLTRTLQAKPAALAEPRDRETHAGAQPRAGLPAA